LWKLSTLNYLLKESVKIVWSAKEEGKAASNKKLFRKSRGSYAGATAVVRCVGFVP
jgi:hypothetical protein